MQKLEGGIREARVVDRQQRGREGKGDRQQRSKRCRGQTRERGGAKWSRGQVTGHRHRHEEQGIVGQGIEVWPSPPAATSPTTVGDCGEAFKTTPQ